MSNYTIEYSSGVTHESEAATLRAAKIEATKYLAHGSSVQILKDNETVARKNFWQSLNRFGWSRWV